MTQKHHHPLDRPHHARQRPHASTNTIHPSSRYRSMLDIDTPLPPPNCTPHPPPIPVPVLREEDECPICHAALPPRAHDGSERAREQHVASCIESHFSTSTPRASHPPPTIATPVATPSQAAPRHSYATYGSVPNLQVGVVPSSPISAATTHPAHHPPHSTSILTSTSASASAPQQQQHRPRRSAGMVVYHASEKDCVGSDGADGQECVICFEEFAVGDEMGRLECLCKFHKRCIRAWWDAKGVGACPVHQGGW